MKQELLRLSEAKKSYANEAMELETFIETQPKPKEIRQKMEKGLVEFKTLWAKSTGSQKKRLISALFDGLLLFGDKLGVVPPMNNGGSPNKKGTQSKSPSANTSNPKNSNVIDFPDRTQIPDKKADGSFAVSRASADKNGGDNRDRTTIRAKSCPQASFSEKRRSKSRARAKGSIAGLATADKVRGVRNIDNSRAQKINVMKQKSGDNRDRTCDLKHAMLPLSQLSYIPIV